MRNRTILTSMVLAAALVMGAITGTASSTTANAMESETTAVPTVMPTASPTVTPTALPTASPKAKATEKPSKETYSSVGWYYVAKGQPAIFKESKKGKIKIISAAGNKYKVSGKKIKITCKKSGKIKYQVNGKKKYFTIEINGDGSKKEYNMSKFTWKGKKYTNYIDALRNDKKLSVTFTEKSKEVTKTNRGVNIGTSLIKLNKKYYNWDDIGEYGKDFWRNIARYYDKKSGLVVRKLFYIKKDKVKKIVWIAYNSKKSIYKL